MLEKTLIVLLFIIYKALWKFKELQQRKRTGINPNVIKSADTGIQFFMKMYSKIITLYSLIIIIFHLLNYQVGSLFSRASLLSSLHFDIAGFIIGLTGLSLCLYSQLKMGSSWRVGIDKNAQTKLVTTGIYSTIRNPTYTGIFLLNAGAWLILPTWSMFILFLIVYIFFEVQVRCEEDHLKQIHDIEYFEYMKGTKRYIPFIY